MITKRGVQSEVDAIVQETERRLVALGERVRNERVLPLCLSRGLLFSSGMGTFFFHPR